LHRIYNPALRFALKHRLSRLELSSPFLEPSFLIAPRLGSEFLPHLEEGNFWIRASMPITLSLEDGEAASRKMREILLRHPRSHYGGFAAWPARRRQRCVAILECRIIRAAEAA
jgi:cobalt-zinc-cadmium resistance protein CzcA